MGVNAESGLRPKESGCNVESTWSVLHQLALDIPKCSIVNPALLLCCSSILIPVLIYKFIVIIPILTCLFIINVTLTVIQICLYYSIQIIFTVKYSTNGFLLLLL